jgi:molybdate transport system substrate-binding protein
VFAAASPATMKTVTDAGNAEGEPVVFVRNQLVIAVEKGNPLGITGLADLARPDVTVALCAEQVPCGAAAKTAIAAAGLTITPVSYEENVRGALSKVTLGEVDAALVYRTDTAVEPAVDAVEFPESASAINSYPIVVLIQAPNKAGAAAFVAYVRSSAGAATLTAYGFQQP